MTRTQLAGSALVFLIAACAKDAPPPADTASVAPTPPAPTTPAADAAPATFKVRFETSKGPIVIEAHRDWAPNGVDRFYQLVEQGYYDDVRFFRVVPGFVVQFGLSADPAVNKVWDQAKIQDDPVKQTNKRGALVFATAGPNTRTTQLFINFGDNTRLDGMGFAPFGEVVEGMDVVDKIYSGYGEQPRQDLITSQGDAYISKNFPKIDKIKLARIVLPAAVAHPAAPAHPAAKPPAR